MDFKVDTNISKEYISNDFHNNFSNIIQIIASLKVQLKCGAYKAGETETYYLMRIKLDKNEQ